jgi:lipopolysaccharide/colanic/teichoic acid biosynthesis glycosyltransferase
MSLKSSDVRKSAIEAGIPRFVEVLVSSFGLILTSPVLAFAAILVKVSSPGPILLRQLRVGRHGREFVLYKFRTMWVNEPRVQFTSKDDPRITAVGRWLRLFKIDELPELFNIIRGDLSLVGPRPEVPPYVNKDNYLWKEVLKARPGITDPVTLQLRNEADLLASAPGNKIRFYLEKLLPYKLYGYIDFLRHRTLRTDLYILFWSILAVLWPPASPPPSIEEIEGFLNQKNVEGARNLSQMIHDIAVPTANDNVNFLSK